MIRRRPSPVVSRLQAALYGVMLAAAAALFVVPLVPSNQGAEVGDVASKTLSAERAVQYESVVQTEAAREEAARQAGEVRLLDPSVRQRKVAFIQQLLNDIRIVRTQTTGLQQQLTELDRIAGIAALSPRARQDILALDDATFEKFATDAPDAVSDLLAQSIAEDEIPARVDEYLVSAASRLPSAAELTALRSTLTPPADSRQEDRFIVQNFVVDNAATKAAQDAARANVATKVVTLSEGQVIARQGETLDADRIEALRESGYLRDTFDYWKVAGGILFAAGFGAVLAAYLYQTQPFSSAPARRLLLIGFSIVVALAAARGVLPAVTPDHDGRYFAFALPLASAAIVAVSFSNLPFASIVAVCVGLFAAFIAAAAPDLAGASFVSSVESLELGLAYTAGGLAGAVAVHRAERLSRYMVAAVAVTLATGTVMASFWLIGEPRSNETLGWMALAAGVNGLATAVIAVGVFVLLSMLFGVTTRLQLMELAQSDHPLLRRLQDEAPGTYDHSMMVGALAERAANRVGADALVARVGAYYHDIGKLAQPHYYIENMLDGNESPHDQLPPDRSAHVIREHVTNGIEIAAKYRLPGIVRDFIPQHHGTRLVTYFYRRAVHGAEPGHSIDPAPYRYAGPRPQTKESAIVMLADSCEAVVRANQDPDRPGIDELVDSIFAERLAEGQMDEADMTMRELQDVASSFKATLKAIYHPRIAYPNPTQEELDKIARADPATAP